MKPTKQEALDAARDAFNDATAVAGVAAANAAWDAAVAAYRVELNRIKKEYPNE